MSVRKKLASVAAASTAGRKFIERALGEKGALVITAIKKSFTEYSGKKVGKEMKATLYKFALKTKIMIDKKQLSQKELDAAGKSLGQFLRVLVGRLHPVTEAEKLVDKADVAELCAKFEACAVKLHDLLSPNLSGKNVTLFDEMCARIGDEKFFQTLINDPQYREQREIFTESLDSILMETDSEYGLQQNTRLSNEIFAKQYEQEILDMKRMWSEAQPHKSEISVAIFSQLIARDTKYYNDLEDYIDGDDVSKQHTRLMDMLGEMIGMLDDWAKLRTALEKVGASHESWAPNALKSDWSLLKNAVIGGLVKKMTSLFAEKNHTVHNSLQIMLRLICFVLEEAY